MLCRLNSAKHIRKTIKPLCAHMVFWCKLNTESECVAELMKMYQKLVGGWY